LELLKEFLAAMTAAGPLGPMALIGTGPLGPMALIGTALMFVVRFYKDYSYLLPQGARWDRLPPLLKVALPFLLALIGGVLFSVASGSAVLPALGMSLPAALAAIGLHHGTKAIGAKLYEGALKSASEKGVEYTPSPLRKSMSIVVPLPKLPPIQITP
jgi:hypothetical protein